MYKQFMPGWYGLAISAAALVYLTIKDIRTKEISLWVCLGVAVLACLEPHKDFMNGLYGLLIGFIPLFLIARIGHGGDGDALVAGALGFLLGPGTISYTLIFGYIAYFFALAIAVIKTKDRKKQLPFIPFMSFGYAVVLLLASVG